MTDNETKTILGIKPSELEEILASAFESIRGNGFFYMDGRGETKVYDKILSSFEGSQREMIEKAVSKIMSKPGVHRIMDQGCGHAQSLLDITRKMAGRYPENEFFGYGISGSLKDIWLGGQEFDFRITPEQKKLIKKYGIHPFQANKENYQFWGIEDDIHKVMSNFPYQLDLVLSDNTYFHLAEPWLALKRTVDKLAVGGVAMVRTIFNQRWSNPLQGYLDEETMVKNLGGDNVDYDVLSAGGYKDHRVLVIIKNRDTLFKTNLYLGLVPEKESTYKRAFYSKHPLPPHLLSIDRL